MRRQIKGQITIDGYLNEQAGVEYGDRGCKACAWRDKDKVCKWSDKYWADLHKGVIWQYPDCEEFMPSESKIPGMCASCKWSNCFRYKTKEQYAEALKRHNGYTREAADDPVEEPNIYCTHPDGSLNRRTAYKADEWQGFGVGHWNRQHEWDTCDRWEEDRGPYCFWDFGGEHGKV